MSLKSTTALILVALAVGATAQTQIGSKGYPNKIGLPKRGLTSQDKAFMKAAAGGNQFEIKSSEAALKNGSSAFVKRFAKRMIVDHGAAFEELKVTGRKKGVRVTKTLPAPKQAIVNRLMGLKGAAFDSAYIKAQKASHAETAAVFEKEIKLGHDEDAKNYAIKVLPTVREHQKMLATKMVM